VLEQVAEDVERRGGARFLAQEAPKAIDERGPRGREVKIGDEEDGLQPTTSARSMITSSTGTS
jgi:hypothetical protein